MLEIVIYILNSVSTKSVPNTPVELWTSSKVTIQHYRIWRYPTYVFKKKTEKLDTKSKLCYFVGYHEWTKGWLFCDPIEQIVSVRTNVVFLDFDYMIDRKLNDRFDIRELSDTPTEPLKEVLI